MHDATFRNLLLAGALTILPGCLAINAALGVFGVLGPPAAQLAGAAYTVAEYSYEYGANDRTPDEVLLAKFDWLLEDGDEPDPAAFAGALRRTVDGPPMVDGPRPVMVADAVPVARPVERLATRPVARPVALPIAEPMALAVAKRPVASKRTAAPAPRTVAARGKAVVVPARPAPTARTTPPVHTYVAHAPDPLQTRLDRWENGLAQAERLLLSRTGDGLRLSVPPMDGDPSAQGVNGGSSLRLPVMRTAPAAPPPSSETGRDGQSGHSSSRPLNT